MKSLIIKNRPKTYFNAMNEPLATVTTHVRTTHIAVY